MEVKISTPAAGKSDFSELTGGYIKDGLCKGSVYGGDGWPVHSIIGKIAMGAGDK
ncbi:MAG: hypothetical protein JO031_04970 [Ktedonobacteraceae bacterium]|nr:hypothetical protein [Ktedonobacteraceae bacterium]